MIKFPKDFSMVEYGKLFCKIRDNEYEYFDLQKRNKADLATNPLYKEDEDVKVKAMCDHALELSNIAVYIFALDDQLKALIKKDFGTNHYGFVYPGTFVYTQIKENNVERSQTFLISTGHMIREGRCLEHAGRLDVNIVAPHSIVGRSLFGKSAGDDFSYRTKDFSVTGTITKVSLC